MNIEPSKCNFNSCEKKIHAKGLCQSHYRKQFRKDSTKKNCSTTDCSNPSYARGMCANHYQQSRLRGDLTESVCSLNTCQSKQYAKGYCYSHYSITGKYNILPEQYEQMYIEQNGKCFICNSGESKLHIDHSHITNKVRALLCSNCNTALGLVKENKETLNKLINYLNKYS